MEGLAPHKRRVGAKPLLAGAKGRWGSRKRAGWRRTPSKPRTGEVEEISP